MNTIRIMLVDDHALVREGTKEFLQREKDLEVVAEAGDGNQAVALADKHRPDVVIMDIAIPKLNGIDATKQIKALHPAMAVLVLTAYDNDQYIFALLEAGAAGYLLKDIKMYDLVQAIRAVYSGESVLHPVVARKVMDYFTGHAEPPCPLPKDDPSFERVTGREIEVLQLAAKGMTNREIAGSLSISTRTVQVHLSNVFAKLGVGSRTEAVLCGLRKGWFTLDSTRPPEPVGHEAA
jgi:two-component system, NarL family, response regulator LiaR